MSDDFEAAPTVARNGGNGGGNATGSNAPRNRPESPRQVLLLVTEKPTDYVSADGKAKGMKFGFGYNKDDRAAARANGGQVGTYDRAGVWKNELMVVRGQLVTPVAGYQGGVSHEPVDGKKSIRLNGEDVYPTGEMVEIIIPVGTNAQKLRTVKPDTLLVLEDVHVRAPANPNSKGADLGGALIPVANDIAAKAGDKAGLVACTDRARGGFFHIGPSARTKDDRLSHIGQVMVAPVPYALKPNERSQPNDAPVMGGGVNGMMSFLVKGEDANSLQNFAQVRLWAQEWESHLQTTSPNATPAFVLQLFRKSVDAEGKPVDGIVTNQDGDDVTYLGNPDVNVEKSLARFSAMREKSATSPQQSILVVARDEKDETTGKWVRMSMDKTIDQMVAWQGENVAKMQARIAEGTNKDPIVVKPLQELVDGGGWDIVFVPVEGYNLSPSSKQNVRDGKFDPSLNFKGFTEKLWPGDVPEQYRKPSESGRTIGWNPVLGVREMSDGVQGSYRPEQGQEKVAQTFSSVQGIKAGYIETLTMEGGATSVHAVPEVKEAVPVPPSMFITPVTPEAHKVDITAQLEMMAKAARAVEFSTPRRTPAAQGTAPAAPGDDAPPTVPGM